MNRIWEGVVWALAVALVAFTLLQLTYCQAKAADCMPMEQWLLTAQHYGAEKVDSRSLGEKGAHLEYWASKDGMNSAIVIVAPDDSGVCLMTSIVLKGDDGPPV